LNAKMGDSLTGVALFAFSRFRVSAVPALI
jgi:hypothetical protein